MFAASTLTLPDLPVTILSDVSPDYQVMKPKKIGFHDVIQSLFKPAARMEVSRNFFANRAIDGWNNLPEEVIGASSTKAFTKKLRAVLLE